MKKVSGNRFLKYQVILLLFVFAALAAGITDVQAADSKNATSKFENAEAAEAPYVALRHWKASSERERYAYLIGFMNMLEFEKEWRIRYYKDLPPTQGSSVGSWVKGLEGVSWKTVYDSIEAYIADNPNDMNLSLIEMLWYKFVHPALEKEKIGAK